MPDNRRFKGRAQINLGGLSGLSDSSLTLEDQNFDWENYNSGGTGEKILASGKSTPAMLDGAATYPRYQKPSWWKNFSSGGQASRDYNQYNFQSDLAKANALQHESTLGRSNIQTNELAISKSDHDLVNKKDELLTEAEIRRKQAILDSNLKVKSGMNMLETGDSAIDNRNNFILNNEDFVRSQTGAVQQRGARSAVEDKFAIDKLAQTSPALLDTARNDSDFARRYSEFKNDPGISEQMFSAEALGPNFKNKEIAARTSALGQIALPAGSSIYDKFSGGLEYQAPLKPGDIMLQKMMDEDTGNSKINSPSMLNPGVPDFKVLPNGKKVNKINR